MTCSEVKRSPRSIEMFSPAMAIKHPCNCEWHSQRPRHKRSTYSYPPDVFRKNYLVMHRHKCVEICTNPQMLLFATPPRRPVGGYSPDTLLFFLLIGKFCGIHKHQSGAIKPTPASYNKLKKTTFAEENRGMLVRFAIYSGCALSLCRSPSWRRFLFASLFCHGTRFSRL